jgi:NAD(P)-dependent dehydrogenase (short-subunit alcohol dehydrogenase family)
MGVQRKAAAVIAATAGSLIARSALRRNQYDLRDKVVYITGGSRGLGLVMARRFGAEGASLAISARNPNELKRAVADLNSRGIEVSAIPCDVTKEAEAQNAVQQITRKYGRIDVVVNNAGVIEVGPFQVMTLDDFRRALQTHFWAPLYTMLSVLPQMQARREGRIVNIASIGGKVSVPHLIPYCSSKFALVGLSEGLRAELFKHGIRVTTVCPGLMRTGSARNAVFKGKHRYEYALFSISAASPLTSISAERAAKQIVEACKRGDAEITISIQAKIAARVNGLFPGFVANALGAVNYVLPSPGGIGENEVNGTESTSAISPSILTRLNDRAAVRNNEVPHLQEDQRITLGRGTPRRL